MPKNEFWIPSKSDFFEICRTSKASASLIPWKSSFKQQKRDETQKRHIKVSKDDGNLPASARHTLQKNKEHKSKNCGKKLIENLLQWPQPNQHSTHPWPGTRTFQCLVQMRVDVMHYQIIQLLAVGPVPRRHQTTSKANRQRPRESSRPSRQTRFSSEPAWRRPEQVKRFEAVADGSVDLQPYQF